MSLPPAVAVSALYERLLHVALRQFFERATLRVDSAAKTMDEGRLEAMLASPAVMDIKWLGGHYALEVPAALPFTEHEVRFVAAIAAVLSARYHAILHASILTERGDLFRGAIEDRYVGAFLDPLFYAVDARETRADRIAAVIELLRVAALSSYENRTISTGVMLLGTQEDPCRPAVRRRPWAPSYAESLTGIKSFYRLADGVRTAFLATTDGRLLDIIDVERWSAEACEDLPLPAPCAKSYQPHARATLRHGHVCAVLSPSREIKIFAEGTQVFAFRGAGWHLLDLEAKYRLWAEAVGNDALAMRIFQTALDLADARDGALFVVVRDPITAVSHLVARPDRLDVPMPVANSAPEQPSRRDLLHLLEGRSATELDPSVLSALASLDGAVVVDRDARLLAAGAILRHPPIDDGEHGEAIEGARTTAAVAASRYGPVLKVSEDGIITFFDGERIWDV
jgi:hypothetical protein